MKNSMAGVIAVFFCLITAFTVSAQHTAITIILIRHAEKETMGNDPALSPVGIERSYKLQKALPDYYPDHFYSTDYKRTRQTVTPWATATDKTIEIYTADTLVAFAEKLKTLTSKIIVVAGHSNTTAQLANLLLGKEKYASLDDAVYNKIWIITVQDDGNVTDTVIEY